MRRLGGVLAVVAMGLSLVACDPPSNLSEWDQEAIGGDGGPDVPIGPPDVPMEGGGSDAFCMMCFDGGFDMGPSMDVPPLPDAAVDIDAMIDAPPPIDAAIDAPPDASIDAPPDAAIDAPPDAAPDAAIDAPAEGGTDAAIDAPTTDAAIDAPPDAAIDASMPDASMPDASMPDASMPDASMPDGSMPDASMPDAGVPDGGVVDAPSDAVAPHPDSRGFDDKNLVETSFYACSTTDAGALAWLPLFGALAIVLRGRGTSRARRRHRG